MLALSKTKNWLNGSASPVYGSAADNAFVDRVSDSSYAWLDPTGTSLTGGTPRRTQESLTDSNGTTTANHYYDDEGAVETVVRTGGRTSTGYARLFSIALCLD